MSLTYFHNFSGRTYPKFNETAFDTMVVSDGYILNIGIGLKRPSADIESVDLEGSVIMPPFIDSHTHFLQTGIVNAGAQLSQAENLNQLFDIVSDELKKHKIAVCWNLDVSSLAEKRFPTEEELNAISSKSFIWLVSKDLHLAIANSETLKWAKKNFSCLKHENGLVSGESYNNLCYKINDLLTEAYKLNCLKKIEELCFSKGVYMVHAMEGNEDNPYEALLVSKFLEKSRIKGLIYNQSSNPETPLKMGWKQMGGCILVDGSLGSKTAALYDKYKDCDYSGELFLSSNQIMELSRTASINKLQLALHAIGDKACDVVAATYNWAHDYYGKPQLPHRIEHFVLPTDKAIRNVRKTQSIIGIQPAYDYYWGGEDGLYVQCLGLNRGMATNAYKTLLEMGITLIGGSDSPVTPLDPLLGIQALVNHKNPDERIGLNQALAIYINEAHKVTGEFEEKGRLRVGAKADFICLAEDPFKVYRSRIKDVQVKAVFLSGQKVK